MTFVKCPKCGSYEVGNIPVQSDKQMSKDGLYESYCNQCGYNEK